MSFSMSLPLRNPSVTHRRSVAASSERVMRRGSFRAEPAVQLTVSVAACPVRSRLVRGTDRTKFGYGVPDVGGVRGSRQVAASSTNDGGVVRDPVTSCTRQDRRFPACDDQRWMWTWSRGRKEAGFDES